MPLPNLADILSKINDGICILDKDRQVTFANDKASRILETADHLFHDRIAQALKDQTATNRGLWWFRALRERIYCEERRPSSDSDRRRGDAESLH